MKILYILLALSFIYACTPEGEVYVFEDGLDYQPLGIGKYWEYSYDSIVYDNEGAKIDTFIGFLRKEITDTLSNGQYRMVLSRKRNLSEEWKVTRVERIFLENNQVLTSEENLLFVNIVFPVEVGRTWDGNAYFDQNITSYIAGEAIQVYKDWNSEMLEKISDFSLGTIPYSDVLKITHASVDNNTIEYRIVNEYYAKNIGLVYKEMEIYDTQNADASIEWVKRAHSGFSHHLDLIAHN